MISELKLANFKGRNATYKFSRGNLISGGNFAGKSAIDQAIKLMVLGYIPYDGKSAPAIKEFASAYPMSIEMLLHDNTTPLSIRLEQVKSSVKQTVDLTLAKSFPITEQTKVLFDPSIFFGLTDNMRISKMCELVQSVGGTPDDICRAVAGVLGIDITPGKHIEVEEPLFPQYTRWVKDVLQKTKTVNELLANSETFWKDVKKTLNDEKVRMQKTVEGLSDISTLEAELAKLPNEAETRTKYNAILAEIAALTVNITKAEANNTSAVDFKSRLDRHSAIAKTFDQLKKVESEAKTALVEHGAALKKARDVCREKQEAYNKLKAELAKPVDKSESAQLMRTDDFDSNSELGKLYVVRATLYIPPQGTLIVQTVHEWAEIVEQTEIDEETERANQYEAEQQLEEAAEAWRQADEAAIGVEDLYNKANFKLHDATEGVTIADQSVKEVEWMKANPGPAVVEQVTIDGWAAERTAKEVECTKLVSILMHISTFVNDRKRMDDAAKKRETIDGHVKTVGKVIDLVAQKKVEIVSGSIEPPLAIANQLTKGILRGKLAFEQGELGMRVGETFIGSRTFSGTETALVMMGLSAGLATRSDLRVLMLDELGRLDTNNAEQLLRNLDELANEGVIDQYIVMGPTNGELLSLLGSWSLNADTSPEISVIKI